MMSRMTAKMSWISTNLNSTVDLLIQTITVTAYCVNTAQYNATRLQLCILKDGVFGIQP